MTIDGNRVLIRESQGTRAVAQGASTGFAGGPEALPQEKQNSRRPTPQELTRQIPREIRAEMAKAIDDSNRRTGDRRNPTTQDDKKGGFHEEAGLAGLDASGNWIVARQLPGPSGNPAVDKHLPASEVPADRDKWNSIVNPQVLFHVHPGGQSFGVGSGGRIESRSWLQSPSDEDKGERGAPLTPDAQAPYRTHIVFAAREKKVYFYGEAGTIGKPMDLTDFLRE